MRLWCRQCYFKFPKGEEMHYLVACRKNGETWRFYLKCPRCGKESRIPKNFVSDEYWEQVEAEIFGLK